MEEENEVLFKALETKMDFIKTQIHRAADEFASQGLNILAEIEKNVADGSDPYLTESLRNSVDQKENAIKKALASKDAQIQDQDLVFLATAKRESDTLLFGRRLERLRLLRRLSKKRRLLIREYKNYEKPSSALDLVINYAAKGEGFLRTFLANELSEQGQTIVEQYYLYQKLLSRTRDENESQSLGSHSRAHLRRKGRPSASSPTLANVTATSEDLQQCVDALQAAHGSEALFKLADGLPFGASNSFSELTAGHICIQRSLQWTKKSIRDPFNSEVFRRGNLLRVRKRVHAWPDPTVSLAALLEKNSDSQDDVSPVSESLKATGKRQKQVGMSQQSRALFETYLAKYSHTVIAIPPSTDSLTPAQIEDDFRLLRDGLDSAPQVPQSLITLQAYRDMQGFIGSIPELDTDLILKAGAFDFVEDLCLHEEQDSTTDELELSNLASHMDSSEDDSGSEEQYDGGEYRPLGAKRSGKHYSRVRAFSSGLKSDDSEFAPVLEAPSDSYAKSSLRSTTRYTTSSAVPGKRGRGRPRRSSGLRVTSATVSRLKGILGSDAKLGDSSVAENASGFVREQLQHITPVSPSAPPETFLGRPSEPLVDISTPNSAPPPFGVSHPIADERPLHYSSAEASNVAAISHLKDGRNSGLMTTSIGSFLSFSSGGTSVLLPPVSSVSSGHMAHPSLILQPPSMAPPVVSSEPYRLSPPRERFPLFSDRMAPPPPPHYSTQPMHIGPASQEIFKMQKQHYGYSGYHMSPHQSMYSGLVPTTLPPATSSYTHQSYVPYSASVAINSHYASSQPSHPPSSHPQSQLPPQNLGNDTREGYIS